MRRLAAIVTSLAAVLPAAAGVAQAHMTFVPSPAYANATYVATFQVPHGCTVGEDHFDTVQVDVDIPAGFTSVRAVDTVFGQASVATDTGGAVAHVTWEKSTAAEAGDLLYYQVAVRGRLPNAPFTSIQFPSMQTCSDGSVLDWADESPVLPILPAREIGWNAYTAPVDLDATAIQTFFADAEIVWHEGAAYSPNPVTRDLIAADGVSALTAIPAGGAVQVKYSVK
jgi:periplasmic copper chaperone A